MDTAVTSPNDKVARLAEICAVHDALEGPLLPILHAVQTEFGCVDGEAERAIAKALNLSRAEVHGVVSFYHDFAAEPDPRPVVQLGPAQVAAGERVTLRTVYCLGLCSVGPNARVGDTLHARLDEAALIALVQSA
jgi:formate dehydrogenase subunit gamma